MKKAFVVILPIALLVQINQFIGERHCKTEFSKDIEMAEDSVKILFNIFLDKINSSNELDRDGVELKAEVEHINLSDEDLMLTKSLFLGLKTNGDHYVEAFDFQENQIEIGREIDYQILFFPDAENPHLEEIPLKRNETKVDTIDLNTFYVFKEKGVFKVRFVNYALNIASNWDTLMVN